ncbi:GNAT family N-acetyltransferase [Acetobacteroides hydrogenigenes]|uniref:Acetyltransferase (GNAT) family protein n=1 Tax=Acetobacteroides hydrogenigenes TaxID=979970 RepID=A0A4R2E655_9BACT|nr:GNAT family N-acetyltransferase [Acetobacteroides hydrogenigenes]TCN62206.1 acetyltransferase (GNAT) family protein [Acetobacteroides hydrogenigenes]
MELREVATNELDYLFDLADKYGTVFSSKRWIDLYNAENVLKLGYYENDGKLIGGVFLYKRKTLIGNLLLGFPFSPHVDIFFEKENKNNSKRNSFIKQLTTLLVNYVNNQNIILFSVAFNPNYKDLQPFLWNNYKVSLLYTYKIDLGLSLSEIEKLYSPERRNDIKKAKRDNVIIKKTDDYEVLLKLIKNTFNRQSKSVDIYFIEKLLTNYNHNNSFIFTAFDKDGVELSSCFFIYDRNTVYYLLSGYNNDLKHHGAGPLCIDEAIKYSKLLGLKFFDFEGSMQPQIEKYFRGFGGDLVYYPYVNKSFLLFEVLLKFKKRRLF